MPHHYTGGEEMNNWILLEYTCMELHQKRATLAWLSKNGIDHVDEIKDSYVILRDNDALKAIQLLDEKNGPEHLLWAIVENGRRIRGNGYEEHFQCLNSSRGRTTPLGALPHELGNKYYKSMTHPDYARPD